MTKWSGRTDADLLHLVFLVEWLYIVEVGACLESGSSQAVWRNVGNNWLPTSSAAHVPLDETQRGRKLTEIADRVCRRTRGMGAKALREYVEDTFPVRWGKDRHFFCLLDAAKVFWSMVNSSVTSALPPRPEPPKPPPTVWDFICEDDPDLDLV